MKLLSARAVREMTGLSAYSVDALRKAGRLPAINTSSGARPTWRFRLDDVENFVCSGDVAQPKQVRRPKIQSLFKKSAVGK